MSFGKNAEPDPTQVKSAGATKADILFEFFGRKVCRHSVIVAVISAAIMLLQVPGMMHIDVNMDYTETMGEKIPFVVRLKDMLSGKLGSLYDFNVMVEFENDDALKDPANMKRIEQLEQKLGTLQLTKISGDKPRVQSVTRLVKEMNRTLNADSIEYYKIPDAQDMLTQLLFLYEISDPDALFERMDENYKTTFIHIELAGYDANKIVEDLDSANAYAARIFPDAKVSVVGEVVNYAEMNGKLVGGLLRSFGGSFVIIAIMMILAFGSIKAGLIGMIPNIPLALLLGFVAYGLSIFTYIRAQKYLGAAKTSAFYAFAPFIGVLFSVVLLNEKITLQYVVALLVMIAGTIFVVYDTLVRSHSHMHQHIFTHTHGGITHTHVVTHSHLHNHVFSDAKHGHSHDIKDLEKISTH
jgi:predicted RND superfamily exporter protein